MTQQQRTKYLALTGIILLWLPIVIALGIALVGTLQAGGFHFDYMIFGELFVLILVGMILVAISSIRFGRYKKSVLILSGLGIVFLITSQSIALVSGLAEDAAAASDTVFRVVILLYSLYTIAYLLLAYQGVNLYKAIKDSTVST